MYNKLFSKIVTSSIWLEPTPTRMIWITFLALMDEEGFAQVASVANLAHTARIDLDDAIRAVEILESPDKNSGDTDHEGRRIERVPGGWMVLNAKKYRDIVTRSVARENTRKRVAEFRVRKRSGTDQTIKAQNAKCACCSLDFEEPYSLYVVQDHDHKTGAMRDLICQSCNKVVGLIENGKPYLGDKSKVCAAYLKRHSNAHVTPSETDTEAYAEAKAVGVRAPSASTESNPDASYEVTEAIKVGYPPGTYRGNAWILAQREIRTLLADGAPRETLESAALAYRAQQDAAGNVGTKFILSPLTFFKEGNWKGPFPLPAAAKKTLADNLTWKPEA